MTRKYLLQSACAIFALAMAALAGTAQASFSTTSTDQPIVVAANDSSGSSPQGSTEPDCTKNPKDVRCKDQPK